MKGYRSIVINGLTAVLGILALPEVGNLIPADKVKYVIAAQGAIAILMRVLTTTPVGDANPRT